jgi:hypothetical protein
MQCGEWGLHDEFVVMQAQVLGRWESASGGDDGGLLALLPQKLRADVSGAALPSERERAAAAVHLPDESPRQQLGRLALPVVPRK